MNPTWRITTVITAATKVSETHDCDNEGFLEPHLKSHVCFLHFLIIYFTFPNVPWRLKHGDVLIKT